MTRELNTQIGSKARQAEEARLSRLCKSIHKHKAGLDFAVEESFGGELDHKAWREAFESSDPHETIRTMAVTGSYSAIVNASTEILKVAAGNRLIGLLPHRRPHADQVFAAAQGDGGLTEEQMRLLSDCYVLEGRLETVTLVDGSQTRAVLPPGLGAGEVRDGPTDSFGSLALYLMLAERADPVSTLPVVDGWGGDAMVSFRRDGTSCLRANIAGRDAAAQAAIDDALVQWVAAAPEGSAELGHDASVATLTACDPGPDAAAVPDHSFAAFTVAAVRNELLGELAAAGMPTKVASCTANGVVADPAFRPVLDAAIAHPDRAPDSSILRPFQQRVLAIATACGRQG